ncbi:FHA domain-containing protein [Idiomarina sp. A28L]|uniref:FHA domain-containing protein n=1 Tax=Idiomarina sp. A28L TaxID=1036674 RepID=UPI0002138E52|nr:FHA domain-containing protein [Idiomarina sp. A28L]EGN75568.1 FHA domain-containing protein [Idiomarina sp. A28L]
MPLRLQLFYPEQPAQSHVLFEGKEYLLGRSEECDIVINEQQVSRFHARITSKNGVWELHDHNSQNGCFSEGQRVRSIALAQKAELILGGIKCRLEQVEHRQITAESSFSQWRNKYLSAAAEKMLQESALSNLLNSATETLSTILSSDRAAVIFLDDEGDICNCTGFPEWMAAESFTGSRTAIRQAISAGEPVILSSVADNPIIAKATSVIHNSIQALLCFPVRYQDQVVAVLYADSAQEHRAFLDTDLVIVRSFSRQLSMALQIQDIERRLHRVQAM